MASIDEELGRFARDGATAKELQESQQYLIGSMPRALETNAAIAVFLQTAEFFGLGLDYDLRLPDHLRAVTLDEVNAAARRAARSGPRDRRHRRALREPNGSVIGSSLP